MLGWGWPGAGTIVCECEFYLVDSGLLSLDGSAVQFEKLVEISKELGGGGLAREQVGHSDLAGLRVPARTSSMVGMYYVGQDIQRNPSRSTAPLPTPAPLAQRAGDVEIGGVHFLEFHWSTALGGGGLVLLIVLVAAITYCCVRGLLQACCLNTCHMCCPHDNGGGGDVEAQSAHGTQGQTSGGTLVQAPSAPLAAPAVAREGSGVVERYQRSLEDILAAHRAKTRRCGQGQGVGHVCGQCQEMM